MLKIVREKLIAWYQKDRRILILSAVFGLMFTVLSAFATVSYSETMQGEIAKEVVRFHVLANSDSQADQALKLKVRDGILAEFKPILNASASVDETKAALNKNIDEVIACADQIIRESGYDYPVTAAVTKSNFPTKAYGDVVLPAGTYDALRIEIGAAEGQNWWCVMFPPLCFVDITQGKITQESKADLESRLPAEAYDLVAHTQASDDPAVKVKFKIVEWWQEMKTTGM
jgi:stage II sporulation protein R